MIREFDEPLKNARSKARPPTYEEVHALCLKILEAHLHNMGAQLVQHELGEEWIGVLPVNMLDTIRKIMRDCHALQKDTAASGIGVSAVSGKTAGEMEEALDMLSQARNG